MSFINPLGFLALLAIPVLVIIYIIKSKYTEQTIPSTYVWNLSERFLKRKNPISRLTGIISLILQILAVVFIALAIAHPVFTLPGEAENYCFILDCSGSMNAVTDGVSRFEEGKDEIKSIINSSANGSTYTLVAADGGAASGYTLVTNKKDAKKGLDELPAQYGEGDLSSAYSEALEKFEKGAYDSSGEFLGAYKFYLITDKNLALTENINYIRVGKSEINRGLSDVEYSNKEGKIEITGTACSYGGDVKAAVQVFADGADTPDDGAELELIDGEPQKFTLHLKEAAFTQFKVAFAGGDSLETDDEVYCFNYRRDVSYRTLIVSDTPFFAESALTSIGNIQVDTVKTADYDESVSGYGLYVFESFTPSILPSDGAVWFIDPNGDVANSGFNFRGVEEPLSPVNFTYSKSSSNKVQSILKGYYPEEKIAARKYVSCGMYRSFTTVLSANGAPVLFVGTNDYGNREVVFAFDFHWTNFPMSYNYVVFMNNLINYTFPDVVEAGNYYCGQSATVNVLAGCNSLKVETPSGKTGYLNTNSDAAELLLSEAGLYKITATVGESSRTVVLQAQLPLSERATSEPQTGSFVLRGDPIQEKRDGTYDDILYIFIILAVIVVADWAVYCYEQYQLR